MENKIEEDLIIQINEILLKTNIEKIYNSIYELIITNLSNKISPTILINILLKKNIKINTKEKESVLKFSILNSFFFKFKSNHFLTNLYKKTFNTSYNLNNISCYKILNMKFYFKSKLNTKFFLFYKSFLEILLQRFDELIYLKKDLSEFDSDSNILLFKLLEYFLAENLICKEFNINIDVNKFINKIEKIYNGKNLERLFILINRINIFNGNYINNFKILCCINENPLDIYAHHLMSLIIYNNYNSLEDELNFILKITLNEIITYFKGIEICYLLILFKQIKGNKEYLKDINSYKKIIEENNNNNNVSNIILSSLLFNEKIDNKIFKIFKEEIKLISKLNNFNLCIYAFMQYKKDNINYDIKIKPEIKCKIFQYHLDFLIEKKRKSRLYIYLNFINKITETDCKYCIKYLSINKLINKLINKEEYKKLNKTKESNNLIKYYKLNEPRNILTKFIIRSLKKFPIELISPLFKTLPVLEYNLSKTTKEELDILLKKLPNYLSNEIKKKIDIVLIPYLVSILLILKDSINQLYDYIIYFNKQELNLYLINIIPFLLKRNKESFSIKLFSLPEYIFKEDYNSKLKDYMFYLNTKKENFNIFKKAEFSTSNYEIKNILNANLKYISSFGLNLLIDSYLFLGNKFDLNFLKKLIKISIFITKTSNKIYLNDINNLILGILINRIDSDYLIMNIIKLKYFLKYYEKIIVEPINLKKINLYNKTIILSYLLKDYKLLISISSILGSIIDSSKIERKKDNELEILFYKKKELRAYIIIYLFYKLSIKFNFDSFLLLMSLINFNKETNKEIINLKTLMNLEINLIKNNNNNFSISKEIKFFQNTFIKTQLKNSSQINSNDLFEIIINYEIIKFFNKPLDFSIEKSKYKKLFLLFYLIDNPILKNIFLFKTYSIFFYPFNKDIISNQLDESILENKTINEYKCNFNIHQIPQTFNLLNISIFINKLNNNNNNFQLYESKLKNLKFFIPQNITKLNLTGDFGIIKKYLDILPLIDINKYEEIEFIFLLIWHLISYGAESNELNQPNIINLDKDILIYNNIINNNNNNKKTILSDFLNKILKIISKELLEIIKYSNILINFILNLSEKIIKEKNNINLKFILKKNIQLINKFIKENSEIKKIWLFGFIKSIDENLLILQSAQKAPIKCIIKYFNTSKKKSFIFKAKDDCRQDNLAIQLIEFFKKVFLDHKIEIELIKYDVTPLKNGGIIHMLENTISRHQVSQQYSNNLSEFYLFTYNNHPECIRNFLKSFVGYSLFSYIFNVKDRHNANILFDKLGFYIHIDFGFIFNISPGNLNLEPGFKLTKEILEFLNRNSLIEEFYNLFIKGFFILRDNFDSISYLITDLSLPCFSKYTLKNLKNRFFLEDSEKVVVEKLKRLIFVCSDNSWTKWYDRYQGYVNDIRY